MKIKLSKNNDHNGVSHGVKCGQEGGRIPALESNGHSVASPARSKKMRPIATYVACSVVCVSVSVLDARMYCWTDRNGVWGLTPVGWRNHVLDGGQGGTNPFAAATDTLLLLLMRVFSATVKLLIKSTQQQRKRKRKVFIAPFMYYVYLKAQILAVSNTMYLKAPVWSTRSYCTVSRHDSSRRSR